MKHPYRSILILLLLCIQSLVWAEASANMRYLVKPVEAYYRGYIWLWYADSPYTVISEMCWNETEGYGCDARLTDEEYELVYEVFDTGVGLNGSIYRGEDSLDMYIFWWPQELGADHNPHPISAYWIDYVSLGEFLELWRQ